MKDGRVVLGSRARQSLDAQLSELPDGDAILTVERATRTAAQNAYLWGVVYEMIAVETGNTPEAVHEYCKIHFNPQHFMRHDRQTGEIHDAVVGGSTASLPKDAFAEYVEKVRCWAAVSLGISIPDPGETTEED